MVLLSWPCLGLRYEIRIVRVFTDRAWDLLPGFAVHLHRELLLGLDDDRGTLGQTTARGSKPCPDLTHVEAVFEADDLDEAIPDV